jgi:hypothetical protein
MDSKASHARRMFKQWVRRQGSLVTIRRITRAAGPAAAVNPPAYTNVVIDGAHVAGATSLRLRADRLVGRFIVGDIIQVANLPLMAVAAETVVPETMAAVTLPLRAALTTGLADGLAVQTFAFAADQQVKAVISAFPRRITDGEMIKGTDLQVTLAAMDVGKAPEPQDVIRLAAYDGDTVRDHVVVQALVSAVNGFPVSMQVQVR